MKRYLLERKWGGMSLAALYVSVVSGVIVALQYDPAHPFYSATSLDLLIPYGLFFRSLHFYSSQIFFLLSLAHLWAVVEKNGHSLSLRRWTWLIATIPVSILLLFTGYVLRADVTGASAGHIAENICLSVPLIGEALNNILFAISEEGMKRVYANHVIGLVVLWVIFAWDHLRRYRVRTADHGGLIFLTILVSVLFNAPMDPMKLGQFYITGPWFFLGLQELLRYFAPFWAGVVFPALLIIALCFLPGEQPLNRRARLFTSGWLILYGGLTLVALLR